MDLLDSSQYFMLTFHGQALIVRQHCERHECLIFVSQIPRIYKQLTVWRRIKQKSRLSRLHLIKLWIDLKRYNYFISTLNVLIHHMVCSVARLHGCVILWEDHSITYVHSSIICINQTRSLLARGRGLELVSPFYIIHGCSLSTKTPPMQIKIKI